MIMLTINNKQLNNYNLKGYILISACEYDGYSALLMLCCWSNGKRVEWEIN